MPLFYLPAKETRFECRAVFLRVAREGFFKDSCEILQTLSLLNLKVLGALTEPFSSQQSYTGLSCPVHDWLYAVHKPFSCSYLMILPLQKNPTAQLGE